MSMPIAGMTENEQKQQLSVAYVHAVAAHAGYACQVKTIDDDSIDVEVAARGRVHVKAVLRSPKIDIQLKATSQDIFRDDHLAFSLPVKNYNDLREVSLVPRLLVVFILPQDKVHWLEQSDDQLIARRCAYWVSLLGQPETNNPTKITVRVPLNQRLTTDALRGLMERVSRRESL
jgi:Domain of unknown function (DUF4365)